MKVEVSVISTEIIKPSSPTPDHLRRYQLSFIDQTSPRTYNPLVLFYELKSDPYDDHESKIAQISDRLKMSLSEVLTLFYPLAGRVKDNRMVDCNDEGIPYTEARVLNSSLLLSDAVKNPNPSDVMNLLPFDLHKLNEFPIGVRLNVFDKGGIAVGVCISHELADAFTCMFFVKTWAAVSRGDPVEKPQFVSAKLFPPKEDHGFDPNSAITTAVVSRRFAFDASKIEAIRSMYDEKARSLENSKRPSRVEALSAFIFTRFMAASHDEHADGTERVYAVIHPINIRPKLDPPLPPNSFGNLYRFSCAMFPASKALSSLYSDEEYFDYEVVRQIGEAIKKVDGDFLKKVQEGEDLNLKSLTDEATRLAMRGGKMISFSFTSLCRFPFYDADFGLGEPLWVSSATLSFHNLVAFFDAKKGNGIEAYIGLKEEHMAKLEADEELIKYVSPA